jgi:ABC-type antimicrobial peptide transport system permease subunit
MPFDNFRDMGSIVESHLTAPRFRATLAGGMASAALFLALFGVGAAMAHSAERRVREVGIRLAVGGSPQRIVLQMVGGSSRVIVGGIVAGVVGAAASTRALSGFLYAIEPLDTLTFLMVVGVVASTAVIANLIPAARVVGRTPVVSLEG